MIVWILTVHNCNVFLSVQKLRAWTNTCQLHQAPKGLAEEKERKGSLYIVLEGELKPGQISERTKHIVLPGKTTHGKVMWFCLGVPKAFQKGGDDSVCAAPGSLDPYFCDQNVPEPFLLKENWRQEFPNALPSLERRFSSVTKLSRVFPAECWKRPSMVSYGHYQLLCWLVVFNWALQVPPAS